MKILLLTPPMTQLNTPYPATAYLYGFLKKEGYDVTQRDPAIELTCRLFSQSGLQKIYEHAETQNRRDTLSYFIDNFSCYKNTIDPTIRFLQGKDPSLALRIINRDWLPEGPSFAVLDQWEDIDEGGLEWAFGSLGVADKAKYYASLYLDDLAKVISAGVDPRFTLSRYGERLAASVESFTPIQQAVEGAPTLVDAILDQLSHEVLEEVSPDVVGLSVPFPGNFLGALRIAKVAKERNPETKIILGGGYVNTELRELNEPRLFNYVDFVTVDDGEQPLRLLLKHLRGDAPKDSLYRTFVRENGSVRYINGVGHRDVPHGETGVPSYEGLDLGKYLSICEMLNPMHRIWSDGRWKQANTGTWLLTGVNAVSAMCRWITSPAIKKQK